MELEENQLKEFNENGFLVLKNFAQIELCDEILEKQKNTYKKKTSSNRNRARVYES